MSCVGCSTGRGSNNVPGGCKSNGNCGTGGCNQMNVFDWLSDMTQNKQGESNRVEVRFKNGRKAYFKGAQQYGL